MMGGISGIGGPSGGGMAQMMQKMQAMMQEKFQMADTGGTNGISNFGEIDTDGSGELSKTELGDFHFQKMVQMMSQMMSQNLLDILGNLNEEDDSALVLGLINEHVSNAKISDSKTSQLLSNFETIEKQVSSFSVSA
jgi:hypothetical protein